MLVVAHFSVDALAYPDWLVALAAEHELVLLCREDVISSGAIGHLRTLLPRHQIIVLLVEREVSLSERQLLEEILNDGRLPVIISAHGATDPARSSDWRWLRADMHVVLSGRVAGGHDPAIQPDAPRR